MDLVFTQDKETKKKLRFTIDEGPVIGSLYIDKKLASEIAPDGKLPVTVPDVPAEGD